MNFFEQQQRARRHTTRAVLLFMLAVLAIVAITDAAVLAFVALITVDPYGPPLSYLDWVRAHPGLVLWTSLSCLALIGGASLYRMLTLASGGSAVALSLGGTRIDADTRDPQHRQLQNVVEETAIAAGIPAPAVYVLDNEGGINAFAAGYSATDAAISVTRGALESFTRDELQGVIAHEFSHILNGDMRLNTRLIGVLFGILIIALAGRLILRGAAEGGGRAALLGFAVGITLILIGYMGLFAGRMIKASASRSREYLADASAVQFTRNPHGIAGALKKIAAAPLRASLAQAESEEVEHMLIATRSGLFDSWFATHPPILERIRAIEPSFDPQELKAIRLTPMTSGAGPVPPAAPLSATEKLALAPLAVLATIGNPGSKQFTAAAQRSAEIPLALQEAARSPREVLGATLALLLSQDASVREKQMARVRERVRLTPDSLNRFSALAHQCAQLSPGLRLPLLEIAFPALRQRPVEQLRALAGLVDELMRMDAQISVLDYALARLLRVQLNETLAPQAAARHQRPTKLYDLRQDAQLLFAVMTDAGHDDEYTARAAFDAGMRHLLPMNTPEYRQVTQNWIDPLDRALTTLDLLILPAKQTLIEALVRTVAHDRQVTLGEAELLRVVCASLHCPLPPLVAGASV